MSLANKITDIIKGYKEETLFKVSSDSDGLLLSLDTATFNKCKDGKGSENLLRQFTHLQMLQEEGIAAGIANGYLIETESAVRLDSPLRDLLQIPAPWPGSFKAKINGRTKDQNCEIKLILIDQSERSIHQYHKKGPLLRLTESEVYLPSEVQWLAMEAVEKHKNLNINERGEYANLITISELQQVKKLGLDIDLRHFDKIQVNVPESISISVKLDEAGDAKLIPAFNEVSPEEVEQRLQQFHKEGCQSLRIKDKILLMDEKKLNAIQEIITQKNIPKEQLKTFLKTPTAYLDATLVDLDLGFSLRVQGVTEFTHAYFGDTDESGIEWFNAHISPDNIILAPSKINQVICNEDELDEFEKKFNAARKTGATQLIYEDNTFDISNVTAINEAIESTRNKMQSNENRTPSDNIGKEREDIRKRILDIATNDEEIQYGGDKVINDVLYKDNIDWDNYKIEPFDYQKIGVHWLLGLAYYTSDLKREDLGKFGSLLADDMGLGKTYMSLVAVNEYLRLQQQKQKPVLVVAPLGLLENWKDEVEKTYKESPFDDIILLQTKADLKKYRQKDIGNETSQSRDAQIEQIRYALKIGPKFGMERLDIPKRLVITTYQTLRDYQFSLASIDWSFVIFDEAQNIKNPNTLATKAAKALKAHFKVVVTGTPVENSLADFWCLMDTAKPGHLNAYQKFRQEYIKPILKASDEEKAEVRLERGKALRKKVGAYMLRRSKEDQLKGLPRKTVYTGGKEDQRKDPPRKTVYTGGEESESAKYYDVLRCLMTDRQRKSYDNIVNLVSEQQESREGSKPVPVLAGLQRLRDISLHPNLIEKGDMRLPQNRKDAEKIIAESGKLVAMRQLLDKIKAKQEKAIIFVINKNLQAFLQVAMEKLYERKVHIINGDTKAIPTKRGTETRKTLINNFEEQPGFGLIIMSPIAAGTGLTINEANNVIHLERHWNPAKETQATDRVYRIGQKKDVSVYLPVLYHPDRDRISFDQNLDRLLIKKTTLKDAVITPEEVDPQLLARDLFGGKSTATTKSIIQSRTYLPEDIKQLSWKQFEAFVAELLAKHYQDDAMLINEGADKGADIIITGTKNILVQVKYSKNEKLGSRESVEKIFTAEKFYHQATKTNFEELIVATNAKKITPPVYEAAETFKVKLIDFEKLKKIMKRHQVTEWEVLRRLDKPRFAI